MIDRSEDRPTKGRGRYQTAQTVVAALLAVGLLSAIFIFQNTMTARIHFLFWSAAVPVAGALILAAVLGGIVGFLAAFLRQRRRAREVQADLAAEGAPELSRHVNSEEDLPRS